MMSQGEGPAHDDHLALLRWYADMGVDAVVDATPHDRFAESRAEREPDPAASKAPAAGDEATRAPDARRAAPRPTAVSARTPLGAAAALPIDDVARSAREQAAAAGTLDALRQALERFEGCSLKATATRLVFADGNPHAKVMAIGEAPGADEDRQGLPFVGRSGQLFDLMLHAIGLDRTSVYIANVVPWRPPGNRAPTPQETAICLPFVVRQIELVAPTHLICLGASSAQTLLGVKDGILRTRGRWLTYPVGNRSIRAMPMLHPAYLLRQPGHKKFAWRDLLELRRSLDAS